MQDFSLCTEPARELLKVNGLGHVVWVQRNFLDLNADPQRCSDFVDVISDGSATNHHSRKALDNLKQDSWLAAVSIISHCIVLPNKLIQFVLPNKLIQHVLLNKLI